MSKTKISEFSTTPGNNTDINGINISEGCAPSGINNAIRELMSDLKEWQSGAMDVYVIPQGTAAAPGIQLYGDLDTGLYGFAANQLGVAVGGASAGYFSSAGWVGNVNGTITGDINATTIDTTNLEVTNIKAKDGTAAITIANSTGVVSVSTTLDLTTVEVTNIKAKDGTAAIALTDSTGVVTLARTTSATNSVNEMLVLEHYSTGTISAGFGSGIKFFGENTGGGNSVYAAIHAVWEGGIGDPSGGALVFLTDGYVGDNTERVRITSEGKVGIGTATPSTTLEVAGSATVTGATTLSATTQNIALGTSQTTGTWTAGGASQTGALTLDQSTKTHTLNLGTGATESGLTKTVNIGTGGVSTSTTAINIGSANGTSTTLNGTVTAATLNSTTIDTTNIEVTNIKAKDGSASATIADSTGVMTIASSVLTTTDINGGTIDGTTIGGSTAAAGTFTTATATTGNITTVNATTVDTTNIEVTNIKAKDGTAALSIADSTGVVSVSANPVLSGGTANGVVYLNASKVATSGTALTFDGTNLGLGTASPSGAAGTTFAINGGAGQTRLALKNNASGDASSDGFQIALLSDGINVVYQNRESGYQSWELAGSEQMRLTSTGLGIGTSSPGAKLDVNGQIRAYYTGGFQVDNAGSMLGKMYYNGGLVIDRAASTSLLFQQNGSLQMTLDSSGNLGLGVTPSAWSGIGKTLQVNTGGSFSADTANAYFAANSYYNGTNWIYQTTNNATRYTMASNSHLWYTAASGTAGNAITFTQAMTLDASGRLFVGNTTAPGSGEIKQVLSRAGNTFLEFQNSTTNTGCTIGTINENFIIFTNTGALGSETYTERARITSGGYFKASNAGTYQNSTGDFHELRSSTSGNVTADIRHTNNTNPYGIIIGFTAATPNGTGNYFLNCLDSTAQRAEIRSNGGLANYQSNNVDLSDIRTKTDISPLASYWNKIAALEIVTYKYKDQTHDDLNIGVIAQQVEQVAPEFVDPDGFGETPEDGVPLKTIYNKDLTFAAIKALQEAMARIEKLEAEMAALKGV